MNQPPQESSAAALRAAAEARALADQKTPPCPDDAAQQLAQQQRLLHDLRVHQIEPEMQNDALRASQTELAASRDPGGPTTARYQTPFSAPRSFS